MNTIVEGLIVLMYFSTLKQGNKPETSFDFKQMQSCLLKKKIRSCGMWYKNQNTDKVAQGLNLQMTYQLF